MSPWVGLSLMLEEDFRVAAGPLFAEESVDVIEWSFDTGWGRRVPEWADALLDHYAGAGRLLGHGVHYSPLSAVWEERQSRWLEGLAKEVSRRAYVHVSEHYGFMTAPGFSRGAPLPVPRGRTALEIGKDRLRRMQHVAACPIGLENLALAWDRDEAIAHGAWLGELAGEEGFVVLDVHNLYCQMQNFGIDADEALATFPLERVREIHVSGGSDLPAWKDGAARVRCDTHDDRVPEPVFDLLARAIERCPNVRAVIFERLGGTIRTAADAEALRDDYRRIRAIVASATQAQKASLHAPSPSRAPIADDAEQLARLQASLLELFSGDVREEDLRFAFERDPAFGPYRELFSSAEGSSLGIAARVVRKYARRERVVQR